MIIEQTYTLLKNQHAEVLNTLTISDVCVGVHLTAVKLSDSNCGIASTANHSPLPTAKKNRDFGPFTPSKIKGQRVTDLFEADHKSPFTQTLQMAVLNALSARIPGNYRVLDNTDPLDLIDLDRPQSVALVGAFQSYMRKIAQTSCRLRVLEFNPHCFPEGFEKYYVPAEDYRKILPDSDVVIITGLTLVNQTLDGLLEAVAPTAKVIVTGPSSSLLPDVLFERNVDIIGATRITDAEMLFNVVKEGGSGYHLFQYCAQKICIVKK